MSTLTAGCKRTSMQLSLSDTMAQAEALFIERFGQLTLDQLVPERMASCSKESESDAI